MKTTISILKADVGSIGGHTKPSARMMASVENDAQQAVSQGMLLDAYVSHTGDDIAIIMSHTRGPNDTEIHQFAWDSFIRATDIAREFGLYGAGTGPARRCALQQPARGRTGCCRGGV